MGGIVMEFFSAVDSRPATFTSIASPPQVFKLLQGMKNRGVPVNCVGFQTHIDVTYINRTNWFKGYKENMERLATLAGPGKIWIPRRRVPVPDIIPIPYPQLCSRQDDPMKFMITEFDAKCTDDHSDIPCTHWADGKEESQAALYQQGLALCLTSSNCISFESWGWTDAVDFAESDDEWGDRHPFPFDDNYGAKPAYFALASVKHTLWLHSLITRMRATTHKPTNQCFLSGTS